MVLRPISSHTTFPCALPNPSVDSRRLSPFFSGSLFLRSANIAFCSSPSFERTGSSDLAGLSSQQDNSIWIPAVITMPSVEDGRGWSPGYGHSFGLSVKSFAFSSNKLSVAHQELARKLVNGGARPCHHDLLVIFFDWLKDLKRHQYYPLQNYPATLLLVDMQSTLDDAWERAVASYPTNMSRRQLVASLRPSFSRRNHPKRMQVGSKRPGVRIIY